MQLPLPHPTPTPAPVTCLGQTFASDDARRAHFTELLRQKLQDPAFRAIEGFPIGTDEAILALSDPPYYTACPNPWLGEIVEEWQGRRGAGAQGGEDARGSISAPPLPRSPAPLPAPYHREPFAADVSEGKNDPIYNAHSYHTKVPHKAIMRYILHYTEPGDIVFDGFCGTGMTGVAAQLCGDRAAVEGLGYRVDGDGVVYDGARAISRLGARRAVLNDLSPAATFIAYNYNTPVDTAAFEREARRILDEVEAELGWMYETWHPHCDDPKRVKGKISYVVYSDIFVCPACQSEVVYWDETVDLENSVLLKTFRCPTCAADLDRNKLDRAWETMLDPSLGQTISLSKRRAVLISYEVHSKRYEKRPDAKDLEIIAANKETQIDRWYPTASIEPGDKTSDPVSVGFSHVHHYYTRRSLGVLSFYLSKSLQSNRSQQLRFLLTSALDRVSLRNGYRPQHRNNRSREVGGPLPGNLYVPVFSIEINPITYLRTRSSAIARLYQVARTRTGCSTVLTQGTSDVRSEENVIDYIFVDPPFGSNLMYSELNYASEAWLNVRTNATPEAIVNRSQAKSLSDYRVLMEACFSNMFRMLKPGHWITIEFHNSQNAVWNTIQEALIHAGFVVADIRSLERNLGTLNQITYQNAVKQDLIISAYKPNGGFEERFLLEAGTADGAWDFVRQHLGQLPVAVETEAGLDPVAERQDYLLFDRMVAFHVQRGAAVPLSAAEFYAGLRRRFDERDGMFFLKEQVPAYDAARLRAGRPAQLALFVSDEKSSLQWLRQQLDPALGGRPQTYQELQPLFLRNLHQAAHEALPELRDLLADSFLQDEDGRWRAPDPNRAEDLERLRRRALLAEFETYLGGRGKIKQFRSEAVRAGFADAYRRKAFDVILRVAERLPERVVQEDPELLMYYDAASLRGN